MTEPGQVRICVQDAPVCEVSLAGPLELGRQCAGEPPPFQTLPDAETRSTCLIVAPQQAKDKDKRVSSSFFQ
jgi:hypothetical protein